MAELTDAWKAKEIDIYFADEAGFSLTPCLPYHWGKIGQQATIPSKRGLACNVFALMSPEQKLVTYFTQESINSNFIIEALDNFANGLTNATVVIMDNASWHTANAVKAKIEAWEHKGLGLFFLPTYSPHLNKVETLWRFTKYQWLKPEDYTDKATLRQAVENIMREFGAKYTIQFSMDYPHSFNTS